MALINDLNIYLGSFFDHPDDEGIKTIPLDSEYYNEQLEGKPVGQLFSAYRRDPSSGAYGTVGWAQYLGKDSHGRHRIGLINRGKLDKMYATWGGDANAVADMLQRTAGATEKSLLDMGTMIDAARVEAKQPESMWGRSADRAMMSAALTPQQLRAGALHAGLPALDMFNQSSQALTYNLGDLLTNPLFQVGAGAAAPKLAADVANVAKTITGVDALSGVLSMGSQAALIPTVLGPVIKNMYDHQIGTYPRSFPWEDPYMSKKHSGKGRTPKAEPKPETKPEEKPVEQADPKGGGPTEPPKEPPEGGDPKDKKPGIPWWWRFGIPFTANLADELRSGAEKEETSRQSIIDSGVYDENLLAGDEWESALPSGIDTMLFNQVSKITGESVYSKALGWVSKLSGGGMDFANFLAQRSFNGPKFGFLKSTAGLSGTGLGILAGKGINYFVHKDGIHRYINESDLVNGARDNAFIAFDGPSGKDTVYFMVPFNKGGKTSYTNMYLEFDPETMITDDDPSDKNRVVVRRIMEADPAIDAKVGDWIIGIYSPGSEDGTVPPGVEVYNLKFSSSPRNATLQTKLANEYFPDSNLNYGNKPAQETEDEKPKNPYNPSKPDTLGVVKPKPTPVKTTDESDDERIRRILRANNDTREPSTLSSSEKKRLLWKDDNDKKVSN